MSTTIRAALALHRHWRWSGTKACNASVESEWTGSWVCWRRIGCLPLYQVLAGMTLRSDLWPLGGPLTAWLRVDVSMFLWSPQCCNCAQAKAEVRRSFITTTVREQSPRSHHKGATSRVRNGDQWYPVLCHCQLGHDIPTEADNCSWKAQGCCPGLCNLQPGSWAPVWFHDQSPVGYET